MDPLVLLRDSYLSSNSQRISLFNAKANEVITEIDFKVIPSEEMVGKFSAATHILCDGGKNLIDRYVATAFKSKRGTGAPYSLDSCLICLWYESASYKDYLQACKKAGVQPVSFVERKDLLPYLTGKVESSAYLDSMAPLVPLLSKSSVVSKARRVTAADMIFESDEKKQPAASASASLRKRKAEDQEEPGKKTLKSLNEEQIILSDIKKIVKPSKPLESLLILPGKASMIM